MPGPAIPKALFFDVFGTLVDWRSGVAREAERLIPGVDGGAFADAWRARYQPSLETVRSGAGSPATKPERRPGTLERLDSEWNTTQRWYAS